MVMSIDTILEKIGKGVKILTFLLAGLFAKDTIAQNNPMADAIIEGNAGWVAGPQSFAPASFADVKYKLASDTTIQYQTTTDENGGYIFFNIPTGVEDDEVVPTDFHIDDVLISANPGETHETWAKTQKEPISVEIYAIDGSLVKTLEYDYDVSNKITAAYWNGTNDNGQKLADQIFIVRYKTDDHVFTGKIAQLKGGLLAEQIGVDTKVVSAFKAIEEKQSEQQVEQNKLGKNGNQIMSGVDYIVEITPTDSGDVFMPYSTIRNVVEGHQMVTDTVQALTSLVDYEITAMNIFTDEPVEGVEVTWKKNGVHSVSGITGQDGKTTLENFEPDGISNVTLDIHAGNQYYKIENFHIYIKSPTTFEDTSRTQIYGIVPVDCPVPGEEGLTHTTERDSIVRRLGNFQNAEESLGRGPRIYLGNLTNSMKENVMEIIHVGDSLFYGGESTWQFVDEEPSNNAVSYNPHNNFFPEQLGWIVYLGDNKTEINFASATNITYITGGNFLLTGGLIGGLKELYGRRIWHKDMPTGTSFMDPDGGWPTESDRTYVYLYKEFNEYQLQNSGKIGRNHHYYLYDLQDPE